MCYVFCIASGVKGDWKSHFTKEQNELASLAKAIGHPARVAILQYLSKVEGCVCGDIVDELPLSQSTVSQHLKELKKAGIIKGEVEGVSVCYCINKEVWERAQLLINDLFDRGSCC